MEAKVMIELIQKSNLNYNLVVTCLDQTDFNILMDGESISIDELTKRFLYGNLYISNSPSGVIYKYEPKFNLAH